MKIYRYIIVLLYLLPGGGNVYAQHRLSIARADSRTIAEYVHPSYDTLLLYREQQGKIEGYRLPVAEDIPIQLDSLEAGIYRLEYTNLFDQRIKKQIRVNGNTAVTLYVDSLQDYGYGLLNVLEDNEWLELRLDRTGCFVLLAEKIVIRKEKGCYIAKRYKLTREDKFDDVKHTHERIYNKGVLLQQVKLNARQVADFNRFVDELQMITDGGCTTTDRYTLTTVFYPNNIDRKDGSCHWDGYGFLLKSLFDKTDAGSDD